MLSQKPAGPRGQALQLVTLKTGEVQPRLLRACIPAQCHALGIECGYSCLGHNGRANATIGRALRLVMRNVGGSIPGGVVQQAGKRRSQRKHYR